MKNFAIVLLIIVLAAAAWWLWPKGETQMVTPEADTVMTPTPEADEAMTEKATRTVTMVELNNSGQTGTAVFTAEGTRTKVELTMAGDPYTRPQPAHVHIGSCPTPGEVKYPLSNVVNGQSSTVIEVAFEDLFGDEVLAVNVHKSAEEAAVYTACGNLTL